MVFYKQLIWDFKSTKINIDAILVWFILYRANIPVWINVSWNMIDAFDMTNGTVSMIMLALYEMGFYIASPRICVNFGWHGSKSYFGSQSKCVMCVAWYIHGYRRGIKTKPHLLLHIFHDTSLASWSIMENMQQPCGFALKSSSTTKYFWG